MRVETFDLGLIDFEKAYDFQKEVFIRVKNGDLDSALILCRHYPVITLGRGADRKNVLASEEKLKEKRIQVFALERGGDVTYHGPGQLIAYPIFNLNYFKKDLHWFLRGLEKIAISFLQEFGVSAEARKGLTGVWIGNKKIASIGIAVRNWISFHGLSINIKGEDLSNFKLIRACGLDVQMTALDSVLNRPMDIDKVKNNLIDKFTRRDLS